MADLSLRIGSEILFVPPVVAALKSYALRCGFVEEEATKIAVAVEEALANVIKHSYESRKEGVILIEADLKGDELCVRVSHQGKPFVLEGKRAAPDIEKLGKERKKGGFGLYLIEKFMDEFHLGHEKEWHYYLMKKHLRP